MRTGPYLLAIVNYDLMVYQNRYFDLQYSMQHLMACVMFQKNPKAAMKTLEAYISDAEAYVEQWFPPLY